MKPRNKLVILLCVSVSLCLCGLFASGCGQDAQQQKLVGQLIDANSKLHAGIVATTQQAPALEADIAAMPAGKLKDEAAAILARGNDYAAKALKGSDDAAKILTAAQSGDGGATIAATAGALAGVPGVGPYAGLIGLAATIAYGIYQNLQKKKALAVAADASAAAQESLDAAKTTQQHLSNVVHSIEYAGPEWTAADAANVAAIQGPATTAAVNAIKAEIGILPVPSGVGGQEQK